MFPLCITYGTTVASIPRRANIHMEKEHSEFQKILKANLEIGRIHKIIQKELEVDYKL